MECADVQPSPTNISARFTVSREATPLVSLKATKDEESQIDRVRQAQPDEHIGNQGERGNQATDQALRCQPCDREERLPDERDVQHGPRLALVASTAKLPQKENGGPPSNLSGPVQPESNTRNDSESDSIVRLEQKKAADLTVEIENLVKTHEKTLLKLPTECKKSSEIEANVQFKRVSVHVRNLKEKQIDQHLDQNEGPDIDGKSRQKSKPESCSWENTTSGGTAKGLEKMTRKPNRLQNAIAWVMGRLLGAFCKPKFCVGNLDQKVPVILEEKQVLQITIDLWKLMFQHERAFLRLSKDKQLAEKADAKSRFERIFSHIQDMIYEKFRLVPYEGKSYDPQYPLKAANKSILKEDGNFVVLFTIEPAVIRKSDQQAVRLARVVVGKQSNAELAETPTQNKEPPCT